MSNIYGQKCLSQSKVFPVGRAPVFSELCDVCPNKLDSWKIIHVVAVVLSDREKATQSPWAEFMMSLGSVNMTCAGEIFSWTLSLVQLISIFVFQVSIWYTDMSHATSGKDKFWYLKSIFFVSDWRKRRWICWTGARKSWLLGTPGPHSVFYKVTETKIENKIK